MIIKIIDTFDIPIKIDDFGLMKIEWEPIYKLTFALVGVLNGGPGPRRIVVKRQTDIAVGAGGVVLALAHPPAGAVDPGGGDALGRVAVALAPRAHRHVRDRVEVRTQHLGIAEDLVAEGVHAVQRYHDLRGRHPFL